MSESAMIIAFAMRWLHVVFGILWIGHLYFFNFVNGNFQATLDAATKQKVVPELMPRALFWFRWAAMITFLTGLGLFGYYHKLYFNFTPSSYLILMGVLFATVMWFNVWFIIWPNQKKIIRAVKAGEKPDPKVVETARKASKLNTFLSIPMVFGMLGFSHLSFLADTKTALMALGIAIGLGFLIAQTLFKLAPKVGKSID